MKKIKNLRTVILFLFLPGTVCTILLINACNKMNTEEDTAFNGNKSLVQTAKSYYSSLANNEHVISADPSTKAASTTVKQTKSIKNRVTPLSKMSSVINWDKATTQQRDDLNYTIIPLKESITPFKNKSYEFFRDVIFYKDKTGKANMTIIEVLSKKGESLGNDLQNIAITAFENKYFSSSQSIDAINAFVFFFDENYAQTASFQFQNGTWTPARASFRSDLDITQ
jgi:hypothetical protein